MAYDPKSTVHTEVAYAINATGDSLFNVTIQASDSPDYTASKVLANTQAAINSPEAVARVVS